MKTLDEAFKVCIEIFPDNVPPAMDAEIIRELDEKLDENADRYKEIYEEVRSHKISFVIAEGLLQFGINSNLCLHEVLVIALAQGVAIGIEMEKSDA